MIAYNTEAIIFLGHGRGVLPRKFFYRFQIAHEKRRHKCSRGVRIDTIIFRNKTVVVLLRKR